MHAAMRVRPCDVRAAGGRRRPTRARRMRVRVGRAKRSARTMAGAHGVPITLYSTLGACIIATKTVRASLPSLVPLIVQSHGLAQSQAA